jgi:hypothetical protein
MSGRRFTGPTESIPPVRHVRFVRWIPPVRHVQFVRSKTEVAAPDTAAAGVTVGADAASHPDADKLQRLRDLLVGAPTGAAAVQYIADHALTVEFRPGRASFCRGTSIVIGGDWGTARAALALVHEVHHAQTNIEGNGANVLTDTRADYVRKMLEDETRARIDSIRTWNEYAASGKKCTGVFGREFNEAFASAVETLRRNSPGAPEAELTAAGEKAGYEAVMKGFTDGDARTSKTNETYPVYYEKVWDERHPPSRRSTP